MKHSVVFVFALVGCASDVPFLGQFGEDEDYGLECLPGIRTPVADSDTVSLLGYGGEVSQVLVGDSIAAAEGLRTATLVWERTGEQTDISVSLTRAGGVAEVVEYVHADPDHEPGAVESACPTLLEIAMDAQVETTDGRLAEAFVANVQAKDLEGSWLDARIQPPGGTIDPVALSVSDELVEPDVIALHVRVIGDAGSGPLEGSVSPVFAQDPEGDAPVLAVWSSGISEDEQP